MDGTRKLVQIYERPLIGTIVKPSIGLSTSDLQSVVRDLAIAGLDFIKDDELHADLPYAPLAERVPAVMAEIERVADQTGKKTMYAFNISGDVDHMLRAHDLVIKHGGTCVMISVNNVGIAALAHLRKHRALPIHGHRNNLARCRATPFWGSDSRPIRSSFGWPGWDHLHVGGLDSKFYQTDEEVAQSITDCLTPLFGDYRVMPAISSAQWAGSAKTYAETRTIDVIHLAGGGSPRASGRRGRRCEQHATGLGSGAGGHPAGRICRDPP